MTLRKKLEYFWDYYKWHFIITIFVIYAISNIIYTNITEKEYVLRGQFLNAISDSSSQVIDSFTQEFPINTSSEQILFDTSLYYRDDSVSSDSLNMYQTLEILITRIVAGDIDFLVAEQSTMDKFIYNQYFYELHDILTEQQWEKYSPYFLYYDKAFVEYLDTIDFLAEEVPEIVYPDSSKPELMEDPVPVMIRIPSTEKLSALYPNNTKEYSFAFAVNGKNPEKALEFLEYIMK